MDTTIRIENEAILKGRWLRIHIPYDAKQSSMATIQNTGGSLLKKTKLYQGNNSIDISNITEETVNLKIETPLETILREIKINQ